MAPGGGAAGEGDGHGDADDEGEGGLDEVPEGAPGPRSVFELIGPIVLTFEGVEDAEAMGDEQEHGEAAEGIEGEEAVFGRGGGHGGT